MIEELPDHFKYGPSSAYRWTKCPGSAGAVGLESAEARLGTTAHAYASAALGGDKVPAELQHSFLALPKEDQDEMLYHVRGYTEFVNSIEFDKRLIETKIAHPFVEDHGGTTDALLLKDVTLHVVDLKYGLMKVEVDDNPQIKCYINLGRVLFPDAKVFKGTVYQPRLNNVKTVEFTAEELDRFLVDEVIAATGSTELVAGDHCTFCPLLEKCDVALDYARRTIDEFEVLDTDEEKFDKLADIVGFGKAFNKILNRAKRDMIEMARYGTKSEKVKVVYKLSARFWSNPQKAEQVIRDLLSMEDWDKSELFTVPREPQLKSPNQIEKYIKSVLGKKVKMDEETDRKVTGYEIVPRSSSREEVDFMDGFIDLGDQEEDFDNED